MIRRAPLLLATRSAGKLRELKPLFAAAGRDVIDLQQAGIAEDPLEDALEAFATFEENAQAKARYFAGLSGMAAIADDSGLEVAALGGAPGVFSKRWSGRHDLEGPALDAENTRLLLARLAGEDQRSACFVCVAFMVDGAVERSARGEVRGRIARTPRGTGGFGYDPVFLPEEGGGRSFAELRPAEKSGMSHRGQAFASLLRWIAEVGERD